MAELTFKKIMMARELLWFECLACVLKCGRIDLLGCEGNRADMIDGLAHVKCR